MGFLKSLVKVIATKIGVVVGGDYNGVQVGYGLLDPNEKGAKTNDALIFFTKPEEYRFGKKDVESYTTVSATLALTTYEIKFKDGKKSLVQIQNQYIDKVNSALY